MDKEVQTYVDSIAPENRPLFARFHKLVLGEFPEVEVVISYKMPTYKLGKQRLHVGAWIHGISLYGGWVGTHDGGFAERHPELVTGKGTVKLRPEIAAGIADDEFRDLIRAALRGD